ncbi:MAG TPA: alpha-L-arabinofuranosidase C-terminal domain-containing protein, partial [Protaetiibacter sp.]|nr:alpha-L-arabinofuranosidase C-terminal domain-containing protein [Protaetiibacter sp.]
LVNVIAPIMTEPGGPAWRQTTFFPFATTSRLARGEAVRLALEVPAYETAKYGTVPLVDAVATHDEASGASAVFLVNRSQDASVTVTVDVRALGAGSLVSAQSLHDVDPDAANTLENPERVALQQNDSARIADGVLTIELPPISWTALELAP